MCVFLHLIRLDYPSATRSVFVRIMIVLFLGTIVTLMIRLLLDVRCPPGTLMSPPFPFPLSLGRLVIENTSRRLVSAVIMTWLCVALVVRFGGRTCVFLASEMTRPLFPP